VFAFLIVLAALIEIAVLPGCNIAQFCGYREFQTWMCEADDFWDDVRRDYFRSLLSEQSGS